MSHRVELKQARRAERLEAEAAAARAERRRRRLRHSGYATVAVIAAILVTLSAVLSGGASAPSPVAAGTQSADVGSAAPAFALTDAVSGKTVTSASLRGRRTMLFFSEGVSCQACMVQAADLERAGTLSKAGIRLVSVTTDARDDLADAARQYGIDTPLLADPTREMSAAYGMLGHGGMGHPQADGHAFMLLDERGRIAWHQAYQDMYVRPGELMRDMRAAVKS